MNSLFYFLANDENVNAAIIKEIERVLNDISLIEASKIAFDNLESIIILVRSSENEIELEQKLQKTFLFNKSQANHVANLELNDLEKQNYETIKLLLTSYLIFLENTLKSLII
jgi:DNA gyrase/topoisomerase IV subunit A